MTQPQQIWQHANDQRLYCWISLLYSPVVRGFLTSSTCFTLTSASKDSRRGRYQLINAINFQLFSPTAGLMGQSVDLRQTHPNICVVESKIAPVVILITLVLAGWFLMTPWNTKLAKKQNKNKDTVEKNSKGGWDGTPEQKWICIWFKPLMPWQHPLLLASLLNQPSKSQKWNTDNMGGGGWGYLIDLLKP